MIHAERKYAYDLESRTSLFGENIISFCRSFKRDPLSLPPLTQIIRSATSIGANYMEANGANTRKEFIYKISLCKKEANETKYWLKMLGSFTEDRELTEKLGKECHELVLIFQKIGNSASIKANLEPH